MFNPIWLEYTAQRWQAGKMVTAITDKPDQLPRKHLHLIIRALWCAAGRRARTAFLWRGSKLHRVIFCFLDDS